MAFANIIWFEVVATSFVYDHLTSLAAVALPAKSPYTILAFLTVRHLECGEGEKRGGREGERDKGRGVMREGGERGVMEGEKWRGKVHKISF